MKHFSIKEFACRCWCKMPDAVIENIEALVANVLDPVRDKFGNPVKINSGYRCKKHNAEVGGAKNSQHVFGQAADVCAEPKNYANMTVWREANQKLAGLVVMNGEFDQLILENVGEDDLLPQWVHVSYSRTMNRGRVLKKLTGRRGYVALTTDEISELLGASSLLA